MGDSSKFDALAESVDAYNPGLSDGEVHDSAAYDAYVRELRTGVPDFRFTEELTVTRDDLVIVEFSITGTHEGTLKRIPPTGRSLELRGMETILETVQEAGHEVKDGEPHKRYGAYGRGWAAYVRDPDGRRVELKLH